MTHIKLVSRGHKYTTTINDVDVLDAETDSLPLARARFEAIVTREQDKVRKSACHSVIAEAILDTDGGIVFKPESKEKEEKVEYTPYNTRSLDVKDVYSLYKKVKTSIGDKKLDTILLSTWKNGRKSKDLIVLSAPPVCGSKNIHVCVTDDTNVERKITRWVFEYFDDAVDYYNRIIM